MAPHGIPGDRQMNLHAPISHAALPFLYQHSAWIVAYEAFFLIERPREGLPNDGQSLD